MTITREDLQRERRWHLAWHIDFAQSFENHYRHNTWPRLTCIVEHPRGRRSKVQFSKRFFVDGVEVYNCTGLLDRLNRPQLAIAGEAYRPTGTLYSSDSRAESSSGGCA